MFEKSPEQFLEYIESPQPEEFVAGVMRRVKREQQMRTVILAITGLIGSLFGIAGMMMLSGLISSFFAHHFEGGSSMPVSVLVTGVLVLLFITLSDELKIFE